MDADTLSNDKRNTLEQFRNNVQDVLKPNHDDKFLLRWLIARNFDLEKAEQMLRNDVKFRKKYGSDNIITDFKVREELLPYQDTCFLGYDNEGRLVRFFNFGICDYKGFVRSMSQAEVLKQFIQVMENDLLRMKENNEKTGKNGDKVIFLCDFKDLKYSHFYDKRVRRVGIKLCSLYQDHYPEILYRAYSVNVTNFFYVFYNIFKPFIDERVLKKIKIYRNDSWLEEVFETMSPDIIPAYLGGKMCEPDPKCHALLCWRPLLPKELYLTHRHGFANNDPKVMKKFIRERSYFEVEKVIEKTPSILSWKFQTEDYNLKFGLFFEPHINNNNKEFNNQGNKQNDSREELIDIEDVDCHEIPEMGEYICRIPGKYVLYFDNAYSWFKSKSLRYKVEVKSF